MWIPIKDGFGYDVANNLKDCAYFSLYFYFFAVNSFNRHLLKSNSVPASGNLAVKTIDAKQFTEKFTYTVINLCYNMENLEWLSILTL